jgi:hypothetical protein
MHPSTEVCQLNQRKTGVQQKLCFGGLNHCLMLKHQTLKHQVKNSRNSLKRQRHGLGGLYSAIRLRPATALLKFSGKKIGATTPLTFHFFYYLKTSF